MSSALCLLGSLLLFPFCGLSRPPPRRGAPPKRRTQSFDPIFSILYCHLLPKVAPVVSLRSGAGIFPAKNKLPSQDPPLGFPSPACLCLPLSFPSPFQFSVVPPKDRPYPFLRLGLVNVPTARTRLFRLRALAFCGTSVFFLSPRF